MSGRIHPARQAGDDDHPRLGETAREGHRHCGSVRGARPRPDHRHAGSRDQGQVTGSAQEQAGRWIVNRPELRRKGWVGAGLSQRIPRVARSPRNAGSSKARRNAWVAGRPGLVDEVGSRCGGERRTRELTHAASSAGAR